MWLNDFAAVRFTTGNNQCLKKADGSRAVEANHIIDQLQ